jgi:hypothetical protein
MLDWLLWIGRFFQSAFGLGWRRLKQAGVDRQALRREGAEVVTPVSEFVRRTGPANALLPGDDEAKERLRSWRAEWANKLRPRLLVYGNQHPSGRVTGLAADLAEAVEQDLMNTVWAFIQSGGDPEVATKIYEIAAGSHETAKALADSLLAAVRAY